MKILVTKVRRIKIVVPIKRAKAAFDFVDREGYRITHSGPTRGRKTTFSERTFYIVAEKEESEFLEEIQLRNPSPALTQRSVSCP